MSTELYVEMASLREHIKLLHFQTKQYSVHKTSDSFLTKYDELFDKFWETAQSNKFKVLITTSSIQLKNMRSFEDLKPLLNKITNLLENVTESYLVAVRDELLGEISQFYYLMTFV